MTDKEYERIDVQDAYYDMDLDRESDCHVCGGEGLVWGSDLGDPLWYDPEELHDCPCCGGSGDAKDCSYW